MANPVLVRIYAVLTRSLRIDHFLTVGIQALRFNQTGCRAINAKMRGQFNLKLLCINNVAG